MSKQKIEEPPNLLTPPPEPNSPPRKRRVLSSPLQAMARIEQEMSRLTKEQQCIVANWYIGTYYTPVRSLQGMPPGEPVHHRLPDGTEKP